MQWKLSAAKKDHENHLSCENIWHDSSKHKINIQRTFSFPQKPLQNASRFEILQEQKVTDSVFSKGIYSKFNGNLFLVSLKSTFIQDIQ